MRCHTGAEWSLIHHDWCPYTKRKRGHRERTTWEDEDRWDSAYTSQGTCHVASKPLEAGREAWDMFSLSALGGNQPCPSLEFRLWASRTKREKSLWFKPPSLWDSVMEVLADPLHPWMALLSQFTALTTVNMNNKDLRNDIFYSRDMTPTPLASIPAQISLDFPIGLLFPFPALREPWVLNETVTGEESRISASHLFGNVPCSVFSSQ